MWEAQGEALEIVATTAFDLHNRIAIVHSSRHGSMLPAKRGDPGAPRKHSPVGAVP